MYKNSDDGCVYKALLYILWGGLLLLSIRVLFETLFDFEDFVARPIARNEYGIVIMIFFVFAYIFANITYFVIRIYIKKYSRKEYEMQQKYEDKLREVNQERMKLNMKVKRFEDATSGDYFLFTKIPTAIADLKTLAYDEAAYWLQHKPHPAIKSAEEVKNEYKKKTNDAIRAEKIATYKLEALLAVYPQLKEYIEDERGIKELLYTPEDLESTRDLVVDYLSKDEWQKLSSIERNQLALDRYVNGRKKDNWGIGKEYEMSCAYVYENKGFCVERCGVEKKYEDLGRDLIAKRGGDLWGDNQLVYIIQCKYWSSDRKIHENVIMQLYGTTIAYIVQNYNYRNSKVIPVLMMPSFSVLSETAKKFVEILGVTVIRQDLVDYPRIKCNINADSKIYHLPFDQQYDRTKIDKEGEFYAWTVKEAEEKGFRRAMRHIPNN